MAKIQIFRQSGLPVSVEAIEAYSEDYKLFYDKASKRADMDNYANASQEEKLKMMRKMQRYLSFGERLVFKKHSVLTYETLPTSIKGWKSLCEKYGHAVIIAPRSDKDEMVLVITDKM
jgi:hypothetical protein